MLTAPGGVMAVAGGTVPAGGIIVTGAMLGAILSAALLVAGYGTSLTNHPRPHHQSHNQFQTLLSPGPRRGMSIAPRDTKHLMPTLGIITASMASGTSANDQTVH